MNLMKKIIIVSPHFVPSNLTAVHRSRLFSNHLKQFGWEPIIVCVHEDYYEEQLDRHLEKLLPQGLRIEKTKAWKVNKRFRLIGDIGLRGFRQMYQRIIELTEKEKIDFLYITIPSFYGALLGRMVYHKKKIPYGIDYIDPWVHHFPGSEKIFSRHWFSTKLASVLEPMAVKHASLISGVAEAYYTPVLERNPHLKKSCRTLAMPYGAEASDHEAIAGMMVMPYLFSKQAGVVDFVYAGAMLPKAYEPLRAIFKVMSEHKDSFNKIRFHFIGTGKTANDPEGYNIKPMAQEYGLWNEIVFEYPRRIPYLDVLIHLQASDAAFILGSTEPHYTPSKVYQAVLSAKPVMALLHAKSSASDVIERSKAGRVLAFNENDFSKVIADKFLSFFTDFMKWKNDFSAKEIDKNYFEQYSASSITSQLAQVLDSIVKN